MSFLKTFPIDAIVSFLERIDDSFGIRLDHAAWDCASQDEYQRVRQQIKDGGYSYIHESLISNRDISIIRFHDTDAVDSPYGFAQFLELADYKDRQGSGWDHIEFYSSKRSLEELLAYLQVGGYEIQKKERPHHTTYDVIWSECPIKLRLCTEPLIEKIKREEM